MNETAAILDPTRVLPERSAMTREDTAAGFSFAGAMNALEARAAQSLETFGAKPQQTDKATSPEPQKTSIGASGRQASADQSQPRTAAKNDATDGAPRSTDPARPTNSTQSNAGAPHPTLVPTMTIATAPAGIALATQQSGAVLQRADPLASVKADATKTVEAKAPRATTQPTPPAPTQDFAKLIARRLEAGGSAFELRLDPPALGRVEAQLKLGDTGEATLSLKFENQSALDHFARDEAALRMALGDAGYDLGGERLEFSLVEETEWQAGASNTAAIAEQYEPQFFAPYSQGVVDLRA